MKTPILTTLAALGLSALLTGCGDSSSSSSSTAVTPPPAPPAAPAKPVEAATKAATEAAKTVSQETAKVADATKEKVAEAAKAVQAAVAEAGPAAQEKFTALVADVKKLIADGKGTEAVQKVQAALANLKLTPEQQKIIDDLKQQAQEALSKKGVEAATKAVGDLLAPKPQK